MEKAGEISAASSLHFALNTARNGGPISPTAAGKRWMRKKEKTLPSDSLLSYIFFFLSTNTFLKMLEVDKWFSNGEISLHRPW